MNRLGLFLATNLAVVAVLSLVLTLLGLNRPGASLMPFLLTTTLFGVGGSFISLLMSKSMAMRATGAQVIASPTSPVERWRRSSGAIGLGSHSTSRRRGSPQVRQTWAGHIDRMSRSTSFGGHMA